VTNGFADVDALFAALDASRAVDDEGGLPIFDHCVQCADLLRAAYPDDLELQIAGLVHDLGWLEGLDGAHDVVGRELVQGLLGDRIGALVGGHVAAKRYLLATDPTYAALLSARSEVTLSFQGGVMDAAEVAEFERRTDRDDLVALRRADDAAKVRGRARPALDLWRARVEGIAAH
jgi:predicted HD phosphohydrolase